MNLAEVMVLLLFSSIIGEELNSQPVTNFQQVIFPLRERYWTMGIPRSVLVSNIT